MKRAEDSVPAPRRSSSNTTTSISDLARRFGAQSLRQQCAVPSPINEDFAHQPSQQPPPPPLPKSQALFHTIDPFSANNQRLPTPPLDSEGLVSPLETNSSYFPPQTVSAPTSHRPSSASDDTTRTDASSPPPSIFSHNSFIPSSYSSPSVTRPGSSASADSTSYTGASDIGIRRQRQRILRRQTSNSHLAEVRALISRMVDKGEMCDVTTGSRPPSPSADIRVTSASATGASAVAAAGDVKQQEVDTMDLDEEDDFTSRPPSRSGSDASALTGQRSRRSSGWTSDKSSVSLTSSIKDPRIRKRSVAHSRKTSRR